MLPRKKSLVPTPAEPDISGDAQSLSSFLATEVAAIRYDELSGEVVAAAKRLLLDTLLVGWAGTSAKGVGNVRRLLDINGAHASSTLWGTRDRCSIVDAALGNGFVSAALDYDSLNENVHADSVVVPAALAVAESRRCSGRALIEAYVAGVELTARLGQAAVGTQKGWTYTGIFGVFGSAAASARLLGLPTPQVAHALGLCLSLAAGTQQANIEQSMTKRLQPALASRNGAWAALAAEAGLTAPTKIFEGAFGISALYQPIDAAVLTSGWGERYAFLSTGLKKYPVCAASHAAMDALLALREEYELNPHDVLGIEAIVSPFSNRLVGAPFSPYENPEVTAQLSIRYAMASVLLRGKLGFDELDPAAVTDPEIGQIASKTTVTVDHRNVHELAPAGVRVTSHKHGVVERFIETLPGSSAAPLDDAAFLAKLHGCAAYGNPAMPDAQLQLLVSIVEGLESIEDVALLARAMMHGE